MTASASALAQPRAEAARAEREEEQGVGDGRGEPDGGEARDRRREREPRDALEVVDRGADDVHARVGVVDPVDRHLVDAQAVAAGEDEQLGVEEPAVVADLREQLRPPRRA